MSVQQSRRIFVTGATGYIGKVLTELSIGQGFQVHGLSRSEKGDAVLQTLGATAVRGDLTTLDILSKESAAADIVIHLAFTHDFSVDYEEVLRLDAAAVEALAKPLRGTNKPLVISSGTALTEPDPTGAETTEESPGSSTPLLDRIRAERHALALAKDGVRVASVRLPPFVYGRDGTGLTAMLMGQAAKIGESIYVGDGLTRTAAGFVDSDALLYLLVAEKAKAGEIFNANTQNDTTQKSLAEAIGAVLNVPVRSVTEEEAVEKIGFFAAKLIQLDNRPSNQKAIRLLGWQPTGPGFLPTIQSGPYKQMAESLRKAQV